MEDTITDLQKKDDDLLVVAESEDGAIIETTLEILPDDVVVEEQSTLLEDERAGPIMDVSVKMVQILFLVNALMAFMAIMLGTVPYFMLRLTPAAIYVMGGLWAVCVLSYAFMLAIQSRVFVFMWFFLLCMALGATCAVVRDAAPLQIAAVVFLQSIGVVLYTAVSPRELSTRLAVALMLATGLACWLIGIYAFVTQQDWISAGIVIALSVLFAAYSGLQIHHVNRHALTKERMLKAVINFYGDPVLFCIKF